MALTHDQLWKRARTIKRNLQRRQRTYKLRVQLNNTMTGKARTSVVDLHQRINGKNLEDMYSVGVDYAQKLAQRQLEGLSETEFELVKQYLGILMTDSAPNHDITVHDGRSHSSVHRSLLTVMFDTKGRPRYLR